MTIEDFSEQYIEGYLFCDLKKMNMIKLKNGESMGACGYPMLIAILAGMELLGALVSKKQFDSSPTAGSEYFKDFWDNYLCKINSKYYNFSRFLRSMVRNGLMHIYLTKSDIHVWKGNPNLHMVYTKSPQTLNIDVPTLFTDLVSSYKKFVKPIIKKGKIVNGIDKRIMQSRLDELEKYSHTEASKFFGQLANPIPVPTVQHSPASGASLSLPPNGHTATWTSYSIGSVPITGSI